MGHPSFIIKKAKNDQFYFVLTAKNGEIIMQSEYYKQKASCENGIESVKTNAPTASDSEDSNPAFITKQAKNDQFYFVLTAKNGQVIGRSEYYKQKASCDNGIQSVKKNSQEAGIDDQSDAAQAA